jgi:hypothetical protein
MVLRLDSCVFAPLYALFWVGPAALLIEMAIDAGGARKAAVAALAGPEGARTPEAARS